MNFPIRVGSVARILSAFVTHKFVVVNMVGASEDAELVFYADSNELDHRKIAQRHGYTPDSIIGGGFCVYGGDAVIIMGYSSEFGPVAKEIIQPLETELMKAYGVQEIINKLS